MRTHNIHKMANVQNTFYYNEHAPGIERWPKPTTIATDGRLTGEIKFRRSEHGTLNGQPEFFF